MVLYGEDAGTVKPRSSTAHHGVCYRCYMRHAVQAEQRWPDLAPDIPPYRPANRHVRDTIPLPQRMVATDAALSPAVLRLYGELYLRGADRSWVAASVGELAEALGYSPRMIQLTIKRLAPAYVEIRRRSPHAIPAFHIVRSVASVA